jgi:serine/threonine-protein kinase
MTASLLRILEGCHAIGCVHRDIKPDNIIVPDEAIEPIVLLDFGLNYHPLPEADFETEHWQEIGNRFLRLPELSAGSSIKQDPRSDVTFAAGILFYILTGRHPDILQDAEGRLPHQRGDYPSILQRAAGSKFRGLVAILDDAFSPQLANRIGSVKEFESALKRLEATEGVESSPEADLAAILSVMDTGAEKRRTEATATFSQTLMQFRKTFQIVTDELNGSFVYGQTGHEVTAEFGKSTLFWTRPGSVERVLNVAHEVRRVGDELIVRVEGETVFRTPFDSPDYGTAFREAIRGWLLANLKAAVLGSNARPPELDQFRELRPSMDLNEARAEAIRSGRHIFLITYDPILPERGKLYHALLYFFQNQRTRDILAASFVIALVPIEQFRRVSSILEDQSMENARWVILDDQLNSLEQAVVYANPQVAEGIAARLAEQYNSNFRTE